MAEEQNGKSRYWMRDILNGLDLEHIIDVYIKARTEEEAAAELGVNRHALWRWAKTLEGEAAEDWALAREARAAALVDRGITIADEPVSESVDVQRNRLRAETSLNAAKMLNPAYRSNNQVNVAVAVSAAEGHLAAVRAMAQLNKPKPTLIEAADVEDAS